MHSEKIYRPMSGWPALIAVLLMIPVGITLLIHGASTEQAGYIFLGIAMLPLTIITSCGFMAIAPNQSRVLLLFGTYKGTAKDSGFFWVNPFFSKKKLSLRIRNFETGSTSTPEKKNEAGQVVAASTRSSGRPHMGTACATK